MATTLWGREQSIHSHNSESSVIPGDLGPIIIRPPSEEKVVHDTISFFRIAPPAFLFLAFPAPRKSWGEAEVGVSSRRNDHPWNEMREKCLKNGEGKRFIEWYVGMYGTNEEMNHGKKKWLVCQCRFCFVMGLKEQIYAPLNCKSHFPYFILFIHSQDLDWQTNTAWKPCP